MFKGNRNLFIIALIAVVNALGYGIIIPILYAYSKQYGLTDFQNGLLFSLFSIGQFVGTPFIGRFSDQYGRKPLLIFSLVGTMVSFLMMAFAPSAIFLFLARLLDGLSAGNIPVASAVISDTTEPKDRAKGFGIIGASFGFGFVFGPAISAFTSGWGLQWPFIIAAAITGVAIVLTWLILPETNPHIGKAVTGKIIDLRKLVLTLVDKNVGLTLLVSLIYSIALGLFIFAFQPFSINVLHLSARELSLMFTMYGIIGLISQVLLVPRLNSWKGEKMSLTIGLLFTTAAFFLLFGVRSIIPFVVLSLAWGFGNAVVQPMIQALLSKETVPQEQGAIQGINASYISLGFFIGPIIGGTLATLAIPLPFLVGGLITAICMYLSMQILKHRPAHVTALEEQ